VASVADAPISMKYLKGSTHLFLQHRVDMDDGIGKQFKK